MHGLIKRLSLGLAIAFAAMTAATGQQAPPPATSSDAGSLFAIILRPGPAWRAGRPFLDQSAFRAHFRYVRTLFQEGRIAVAGELGDDHGLILLCAHDQAEAEAILAADPTIQAGTFVGEVRLLTPAFVADRPLTPAAGR